MTILSHSPTGYYLKDPFYNKKLIVVVGPVSRVHNRSLPFFILGLFFIRLWKGATNNISTFVEKRLLEILQDNAKGFIHCQEFFYFVMGIDNRRMIPASDLFPDVREGGAGQLTRQEHGDLSSEDEIFIFFMGADVGDLDVQFYRHAFNNLLDRNLFFILLAK